MPKNFCEHCGPVRGKVWEDFSTTWCRACAAANGTICYDHPTYKVKQQPRVACRDCWYLWFTEQEALQHGGFRAK